MSNDFFDELNKSNEIENEENEVNEVTEPVISEKVEAEEVDVQAPQETTEIKKVQPTIFSETVRKPKKPKKNFFERPIAVAVLTAFIMCALFGGGTFIAKDAIKEYLVKDLKTEATPDNTLDIPGATQSATSGAVLSNQQIAALVSPSIVGVSNMSYSANSYLNINTLQSSGSGIIISEDGYIVTNNHVISGANKLKVTLASGDELDATMVGSDAQTDIAILKINPTGHDIKAVTLGYSSTLQVGDDVLAIGNPLGVTLAGSVTHGIVSALNRKLTVEGTTYNLIQTDAAINSGNSGGALVNRCGEVIGINSVKVASGGVEGLGFAIPIDDVKDIIEDLISSGYVHGRPSIGVEVVEISQQLAYYYNLPVNYGLYVNNVVEDGSAAAAGVETGDIIIALNGEKVSSTSDFIDKRNKFSAGDTIKLTVNRDGAEKTFSIKLQEDKPSSAQ